MNVCLTFKEDIKFALKNPDKAQYVFCLCSLLKYANFAFDLLNDEKGHDSCLDAKLTFC